MSHPLDNMVWEALGGPQFRLGATDGRIRHFDPTIAMFAAVEDSWSSSFESLPRGHDYGFVTTGEFPVPAHLVMLRRVEYLQMTADHPELPPLRDDLVTLTDVHAPQMLALAELTKPGPFASRTNKMGKYYGVLEGDRVVAMAGERLRLPGFCEVSAVCTHPDFRGRGFAKALMAKVISGIVARSETPFLQVLPANAGAIALYESLGFKPRRNLTFTAVRPR